MQRVRCLLEDLRNCIVVCSVTTPFDNLRTESINLSMMLYPNDKLINKYAHISVRHWGAFITINQNQESPIKTREPVGNEPRRRAESRGLCCMNNFESHLRLVRLISPCLKQNLAHVGLFIPSMGTLLPRSRTA